MYRNKYWVFVLLLFAMTSQAQECKKTLKGFVKDFHDGTPIAEATIQIEGTNKYATTDANGAFILENLCSSEFWVIVGHISCESKRININLDKETYKEILLEHHIEELNLVTVKGVVDKKNKTAQESIIKEDMLERYSALSLGDAIKEISGVSSINTGNAIVKPVINGLHSSRILIMTNNVRLQDQEWGIEHAPNIDVNSAGTVSLIKGANALEYGGDAIGGVIIMNPRRTFAVDSLMGKTILNGQTNGRGYGFNTSLTKSYKSGFYIKGQATYNRSGDYNAPDYNLTNTGNSLNAFNLTLGKKKFESGFEVYYSFIKNKIGILRASHIGNIKDLVDAINFQEPNVTGSFSYNINAPRQEVTHQVLKTSFYKRFKNFGKLDVQYDYQNNRRFEFDVRVGNDRNKAAIDLKLETHSLKSTLNLDTDSNNQYKIGLLGSYQNNFANPDTGVRRLIPDYDKYDFGVFTIGNFVLNETTSLDLGVRYDFNRINAKKFYQESRWIERDYNVDFADIVLQDFGTQLLVNPVFNYHNISASAGISYDLNEKTNLIFNYGLSNRAPNASELFSDGLHHSAARIELGDLRLKKETSNRISGTYSYNSSNTNIYIETFYNHINDFIYLEPSGLESTIRGSFPKWDYKQVNAALFGIDTDIKYSFYDYWAVQNKSSFIKGKDLTSDRPLIDIPSFKTTSVLRYANPKISGLNVELQSEFVLRQNEFPNNNFTAFIPTTNNLVEVDVSTPPPSYHIFNIRGDINLNLSKNYDVSLSVTVNNVFNTSYREYLNRLRYFADELGRNVMVQLKFNY